MSTPPTPGDRYETEQGEEIVILEVSDRQVRFLNHDGREIVHDRPIWDSLASRFLSALPPVNPEPTP